MPAKKKVPQKKWVSKTLLYTISKEIAPPRNLLLPKLLS